MSSLINEKLIIPKLKGKNPEAVINELISILYENGKLYSKEEFTNAVLKRETVISNELDFGVALPHARSSAVKEMSMAIGISDGFYWNADKKRIINLVFLFAIPDDKPPQEHIKSLSAISKLILQASFREKIRSISNCEELIKIISKSCEDVLEQESRKKEK